MSIREDILSVLYGDIPDRMPFSPEMLVWYKWNRNAGTLPTKYKDANVVEICEDLGIGMLPLFYCGDYRDGQDVKITERDVEGGRELLTETPVGQVRSKLRFHRDGVQPPTSRQVECPIKTVEDIEVVKYICAKRRIEVAGQDEDYGDFAGIANKVGGRGIVRVNLPRIAIMRFMIEYANYLDGTYLLYDYPSKVEDLFAVIEDADNYTYETAGQHPATILNLGDNIDKTLSPDWFKKYCVPHYLKRTSQLHGEGKICFCHMDGDIKHILPLLPETGIDCVDGMPLSPMSEMTPKDVEYLVSRGVCVFGVLPATLFLPSGSLELLEQEVRQLKEVYNRYGGIILGASDEFPPDGELERIKFIQDILDE